MLSDIAYELSLVDGVATVVPPSDNNPNNFSDEFHSKFTDLYNAIDHEKNIKKDLDNDYSIQQKRLYPDDIIA